MPTRRNILAAIAAGLPLAAALLPTAPSARAAVELSVLATVTRVIGLGERLIYYGNTFLIAELYAVIVSVLLMALIISQLVQVCDRALVGRWT